MLSTKSTFSFKEIREIEMIDALPFLILPIMLTIFFMALICCASKKKKDFTYKDITDFWIEVMQDERIQYKTRLKASKFLDDLRKEEGK